MNTHYESEQTEIIASLELLIERQRKLSFTQPDKASHLEALGLMVSKYSLWDGEAICLVAYEALTDALRSKFPTHKITKVVWPVSYTHLTLPTKRIV